MGAITLEQYAGPYLGHVDLTLERRSAAIDLLAAVNGVLAMADAEGVDVMINPVTATRISGSGNGGFRPQSCPIGASQSAHKRGMAIDLYDPHRALARWVLRNLDRVRAAGVRGMENPQWTPSWCHLQTVTVGSGRFVFVPDSSPPLASPLPEQAGAR